MNNVPRYLGEPMKKIAIFVDSLAPSGGRERVISNLLLEWQYQYDVILITKDSGQCFYELPDKISRYTLNIENNTHKLRASYYFELIMQSIRTILSLRNLLRKIDYDYVYVATPLNALEAFYSVKDASKSLVISEHAYAFAFNKVYTFIKKFIYPKAYCISVPNSSDTEIYKQWGCNAIYIPHIVTFSAVKRNVLSSKTMINVARLMKDKQQDHIIEAWSRINNHKGWKLLLVGDGEDRSKLIDLIKDKNLEDDIMLQSATKEINKIYQIASAFVLASRFEGFGMVLIEAMSFGVPCISYDCPSGPRDIIKDSYNGFLVELNDIDQLKEKMEQIINMPDEELDMYGKHAFDTILNWDNKEILEQWDKEVFV